MESVRTSNYKLWRGAHLSHVPKSWESGEDLPARSHFSQRREVGHPILRRDYITAYFGCCTSPSPTIFDEVRNFL